MTRRGDYLFSGAINFLPLTNRAETSNPTAGLFTSVSSSVSGYQNDFIPSVRLTGKLPYRDQWRSNIILTVRSAAKTTPSRCFAFVTVAIKIVFPTITFAANVFYDASININSPPASFIILPCDTKTNFDV